MKSGAYGSYNGACHVHTLADKMCQITVLSYKPVDTSLSSSRWFNNIAKNMQMMLKGILPFTYLCVNVWDNGTQEKNMHLYLINL